MIEIGDVDPLCSQGDEQDDTCRHNPYLAALMVRNHLPEINSQAAALAPTEPRRMACFRAGAPLPVRAEGCAPGEWSPGP